MHLWFGAVVECIETAANVSLWYFLALVHTTAFRETEQTTISALILTCRCLEKKNLD